MGRTRGVLVLKTNTKNFIYVLGLLVGTVAGSMVLSSPSHALSLAPLGLVHDTTSLVKDTTAPLLNVLTPKKLATSQIVNSPIAPSAAMSSPTVNRTTSSGGSTSSKSVSSASSASQTPSAQTPAGNQASSYEPLSIGDLAPIDLSASSSVSPHAALLAAMTSTSSLPELEAILHPALLRPTANGWQIAGLLWYWWLVILAAIGGLSYFVYYHYKLYVRHRQLVS